MTTTNETTSNEAQCVAIRVVRETAKAVAAELVVCVPGGEDKTRLAWFPKSMIGGGDGMAIVPVWMVREREVRAVTEYVPFGRREQERAAHGEVAFLVRGIEIVEGVEIN
jgi:hypothetical protein